MTRYILCKECEEAVRAIHYDLIENHRRQETTHIYPFKVGGLTKEVLLPSEEIYRVIRVAVRRTLHPSH